MIYLNILLQGIVDETDGPNNKTVKQCDILKGKRAGECFWGGGNNAQMNGLLHKIKEKGKLIHF